MTISLNPIKLFGTLHHDFKLLFVWSVLSLVGKSIFLRSKNNFFTQNKVINGASDLIVNVLGDKGKHAGLMLVWRKAADSR